jgi:20S proteasome alpha/beta subunit
MTLIIGFRCAQGVGLVSDTKIVHPQSGESSYASKILTPLENTPFIIGASGYSDLFKEFTRKIPLIVNKRLNEIKIMNINALIQSGLTRDEAITYLQQLGQKPTKTQQPIDYEEKTLTSQTPNKIKSISLPYAYSYEYFLDDCRDIIKGISSQVNDPYPLEVLIGVHNGTSPSLHFINCTGREHEIENYFSIGTGSPHVKLFFSRLWDYTKEMLDLIALSLFTIAYAQTIAKDNYVGFSADYPPEAVIVLNDGTYGKLSFSNEVEVLNDIDVSITSLESVINILKIKKLQVGETKDKP